MPVGYHGRAGTVVVSGTDVVRPRGHVPTSAGCRVAAERAARHRAGTRVSWSAPAVDAASRPPIDDFDAHVFGMVLVNDWSARDIQAFEYQPLGPFLGKSFMTSVSPWLVPLDALAPTLVTGLAGTRNRSPRGTCESDRPWIPALHLEVALETATMRAAAPSARHRVATSRWPTRSTGRPRSSWRTRRRTGRRCAPATCSRPARSPAPMPRTQGGSFIELSWRGAQPLDAAERRDAQLPGRRRPRRAARLVRMRCRAASGFGELEGTVASARRGRLTMPYYRQRRRRSPQASLLRAGRRWLPVRGADGPRGLRAGVVVALPPAFAERDRRRGSRRTHTGVDAIPDSSTAAAPLADRRRRHPAADAVRGRTRSSQTTTCASPGSRRPTTAICTATRSATSSCTCSRVRGVLESSFGALDGRARRLRQHPGRDDAPLARRGTRCRSPHSCSSRAAHVRDPGEVPHAIAVSSAKARRSRSATCAGPTSRSCATVHDVPVLVRTRAGWSRLVHATHPFDVVGWDGCVWPFAFSIHDFEPIVGARHQPPPVHQTFEGHGLRRLLVRAAAVRLRRGRGEGPVPPRQRRLRRGALLLGRRLHEPGRQRHRRGLDLVPPGGIRPRPAAGQRRRLRATRPAPKRSR